jgi:DNA uptake protein ComE-like DNA-binding protein
MSDKDPTSLRQSKSDTDSEANNSPLHTPNQYHVSVSRETTAASIERSIQRSESPESIRPSMRIRTNLAGKAELMQIPGVGNAIADRILCLRNNGINFDEEI